MADEGPGYPAEKARGGKVGKGSPVLRVIVIVGCLVAVGAATMISLAYTF